MTRLQWMSPEQINAYYYYQAQIRHERKQQLENQQQTIKTDKKV